MRCVGVLLAVCGVVSTIGTGTAASVAPVHSKAYLAAFTAQSPYAELLAAGVPLPPSRADVAKLSAADFVRQQTALKRVLLARDVRALTEHKRITDANLQASARLADQCAAPRELAMYLRMLASDALGSRQRYMVQSALDALVRAYLVDELQIRYIVELFAMPETDWNHLSEWLPLAACFNMVAIDNDESRMAADYELLHDVYARMQALYASVHDNAGADAAAAALAELFVLHESTAYTRLYAPQELRDRFASTLGRALVAPAMALQQERLRLREHDYFGSARLRLLDLLLG